MDPSQLLGIWEFRREVRDRLDDTEYAADGTATFTPEGDGRIRWAEEGTLRWADRSTPVSRTLFLVRGSVAGDWRVTFEDGRDFHPWTAVPVEHACGRDLYEGTVTPGPGTPSLGPTAGSLGPAAGPPGPTARPPGPAGPTAGPTRPLSGRASTADDDPLAAAPTWSIRWRVTGPTKNYTMVTRYSRLGQRGGRRSATTAPGRLTTRPARPRDPDETPGPGPGGPGTAGRG